MLAKRQLSELVYDAVQLEGINYTLPEVQTLLDGITVGGHKLNDQQITLNQANTWKKLFSDIEENRFTLDKTYVCAIHKIAGFREALEWGRFRSGSVTIAGANYLPPSANQLDDIFVEMIASSHLIEDLYKRAVYIFLEMARSQYFYDVNKRMGRFVMNAILLHSGFPVINLPAKRQLEFNQKMLRFYDTRDHEEMTQFMLSCIDAQTIKIMNE